MAKTLLQGVNEVLQRVSVVSSQQPLGSLVNSGKQVWIDLAVQVWNESVDELFDTAKATKPQQLASGVITLTTGNQSYSLNSDVITLLFPMYYLAENYSIYEYPGGWDAFTKDVYPDTTSLQGMPNYVMPYLGQTDSTYDVFFDRIPTANEDGRVISYNYKREMTLSEATDRFPFNDQVFRAMVPAVAELWSKEQKKDFDQGIYDMSIGRAARIMRGIDQRGSWIKTGGSRNLTDPMEPGSAA